MLRIVCILFCICGTILTAQESGWADSVGFKQQKMKIGTITQVIYSTQGDSLYTVSKDSVWHIHTWDSETGKLLRHAVVLPPFPVKRFYSLNIAMDCHTYMFNAADTSSNTYSCIFDMRTDTLISKILIYKGVPFYCNSMFDFQKKYLWISINIYGSHNDAGQNGYFWSGYMYLHEFIADTVKTTLLDQGFAADSIWAFAIGKKVIAFKGFNIDYVAYHGRTITNTSWMGSRLVSSNHIVTSEYQAQYSSGSSLPPWNLNSFCVNITPDGTHFIECNNNQLVHKLVQSNVQVNRISIPLTPTTILTNLTSYHALLIKEQQLIVYNLLADVIVDSIKLPTSYIYGTYRSNKQEITYTDKNNSLKVVSIVSLQTTVMNDFKSNVTRCYSDSIIYFIPTIRERYPKIVWNFGDGTTDTSLYPNHTYKIPGIYTVTLRITDSTDLTEIITKTNYITVLPQLIPDFSGTPSKGKAPLNVQFKDESKGSVISWKWDFGDGSKPDTTQNPTHVFTSERYFNITLTVSDGINTKTISKKQFIMTDTITYNSMYISKGIVRSEVNISSNMSSISTNNSSTYKYGTLYNGSVIVSDALIYEEYGSNGGPYRWNQDKLLFQFCSSSLKLSTLLSNWYYLPWRGSDRQDPFPYSIGGGKVVLYRDSNLLVSHQSFGGVSAGMYDTKRKKDFTLKNWSHGFEVVCLKDSVDVYTFNQGYTTYIDFVKEDFTLIRQDSIHDQALRPIASKDSNSIIIYTNLFSSLGDSSKYIVKYVYNKRGELLSSLPILKKTQFRAVDIIDIDSGGDVIIAGYIPIDDSARNKPFKGYLCRISGDGRILWEYTSSTWTVFRKLQRLSHGNFSAWGNPSIGLQHGFIAFNSSGQILSDNRVANISSSFSLWDFVINTDGDNIWLIGYENVKDQGMRSAIYTCNNPVLDITSDVEEHPFASNEQLVVFPQPTSDNLTIQWNANKDEVCEVVIHDGIGLPYTSVLVDAFTGKNTKQVSTVNFPSGVYYISIRSQNQILRLPFVVVH